MHYKESSKTYILRLECGEEIVETITKFLREMNVEGGSISAIGATTNVTLQYFNMDTKEYEEGNFPEEYEILSLTGNVSLKGGKPWPHMHIILGTKDYECIGGHLKSAIVGATCEVVIRNLEMKLERALDDETKLHLLSLSSTDSR